MTLSRTIAAGLVAGGLALAASDPAAAAGASVGARAGEAVLPVAETSDLVEVAEQWRGNRRAYRKHWRGRDRWHRGKWRHRHRAWRKRHYGYRHHRHNRYYYYDNDYYDNGVGIALGAAGLFFGLSALAARPYYYDNYYSGGYSGGYAAPPSNNCSRFARWSTPWYRCCSAKYRTFNPRTGRYRAYSGRLRFCR